jgi:hypothetical protein
MVKATAIICGLLLVMSTTAFAATSGTTPTAGTAKPVAILDVTYTRLIPNTKPPAMCDAAHDNALAMTHTRRLCVCVNSQWTDSVYGSACSW